MSHKARSTFVLTHPSEILQALVGLKDVRVLHYKRSGPDVELMIEQQVDDVRCPRCGGRAQVKERPVVSYVDLPVFGTPMQLGWKKHRMRRGNTSCVNRTWVLSDHRIAAKHCPLTTRAAKRATVQVGGGRTVSEVAGELACDWHTVNDAVVTYETALLHADRRRLNKTTAIGLDETSFTKLGSRSYRDYATTVADAENHRSSTSSRAAIASRGAGGFSAAVEVALCRALWLAGGVGAAPNPIRRRRGQRGWRIRGRCWVCSRLG